MVLSDNKYLYNGKELQDEQLGGINLDLYDYHMRQYDPALGRFTTPDPHAESYLDFSPYHYVLNNPLNATDPDGMDVFAIAGGTRYTGIDAQNAFRKLQASSSNPDDPPKKNEKKEEKKDDVTAQEVYQNLLSGAEKKDFSGFKGKFEYFLNSRSFDGFNYNLNGEAIGITPITGIAYTPGMGAAKGTKWIYGGFKSAKKWANQFAKRGWNEKLITEAIAKGKRFKAVNNINKANGATRYIHPRTGKSVVIDNVTKELIHVGGPGYKY